VLDLVEHLVEGLSERDHLIVTGFRDSQGKISGTPDGFHTGIELTQRSEDEPLEEELHCHEEDDTEEDDGKDYDKDRVFHLLVNRAGRLNFQEEERWLFSIPVIIA
jgi:hypothetical protein